MPSTVKPAKPTLGQTIKRLRLKAGHTQQELATLIGYKGDDAGAYISRIESDTQEPRMSTLHRLVKALKVKMAELIS